jgi:hypothetical protein
MRLFKVASITSAGYRGFIVGTLVIRILITYLRQRKAKNLFLL